MSLNYGGMWFSGLYSVSFNLKSILSNFLSDIYFYFFTSILFYVYG